MYFAMPISKELSFDVHFDGEHRKSIEKIATIYVPKTLMHMMQPNFNY